MNIDQKEEIQVVNVQMTSSEDVLQNTKFIVEILKEIESQKEKVDLICFPENSLFIRVNEQSSIHIFRKEDEVFNEMVCIAKSVGCFIHLGSIPLLIEDKVYNSTIWITPSGVVEESYQKIHLFDINLEGQKPIKESDSFQNGLSPKIKNIFGWKIGESICYDIRFAELYNFYAYNSVDLILVPASFLESTGQAHWEVLIKARAIESQVYIVASCQTGIHKNIDGIERETFGHSMIVDPWGQVLSNQKKKVGFEKKTLSRTKIQSVRRQIPMVNHRRLNPFFKV